MTVIVQVYDPAMCCSTGVCGPAVDPQLVRFAADLDWLKKHGVRVTRYNLAQQPGAFAQDAEVKAALETKGDGALPLIKVNGVVKALGIYPSREEMAHWLDSNVLPTEEANITPKESGCCGGARAPARVLTPAAPAIAAMSSFGQGAVSQDHAAAPVARACCSPAGGNANAEAASQDDCCNVPDTPRSPGTAKRCC